MVTDSVRVSLRTMRAFNLLALLLFWQSCAVNPVTGDRELGFVSAQQEIAIGQENYGPMQQSEGGRFAVDPSLSAYVNEVGQRLVEVSDRDLPYEFVVLNNGVPNAWALPGGKIAINRGLLVEMDSEAELAAVLGHEIVHSAARHGAQSMERGMLLQGAMVATSIAASDSQYAGFIVGGAQVGAQLISQRYGRDAERESDRYGTRYMALAGYDPAAAISLQETFLRLSEGRQQGWLDGLFASHPPSAERVENNRQLVSALRDEGFTGGERGVDRYREQTAFLRENRAAYEKLDESRQLAVNGELDQALQLISEAVASVPGEARFHGLRGDILLARQQHGEAIQAYDEAIRHDDGYYDYYLGRGLAQSRRGDRSQARADLEASVALLPTAIAMSELGSIAEQAGDRQQARNYYQQAAQAPGELGEAAMQAFVRLDMADNPGEHLAVQGGLDNAGQLVIQVSNRSPVNVEGVRIRVEAVLGSERGARDLNVGRLNAGQQRTVGTGLTMPEGSDPSQLQVGTTILRARVRQ
ncbi:MAG: M48 family metalloprotease [Pseudohongiellaceae bacterium]